MVTRNTNIISQKEYDNANMEYVKIVKESVITKGNYVILNKFWNVYTRKKVSDPKLNLKSGTR